jgi:hydrogenase-4 component B
MTPIASAILLLSSLIGTLVSMVVSCLWGNRAHRIANVLLAVSAAAGLLVSCTVILADPLSSSLTSVLLPQSLFPATADPGTIFKFWPLFYNMVLGLDRFSAIFYGILSLVTGFVAIFAITYLGHDGQGYSLRTINILTGLFVFGMQGVILASNIVGFMAFWELMSISSFFLILSGGSLVSRRAGFLYLIMTHVSGGLIMAGLFTLSSGALLSDFSGLAAIAGQLPTFSLQAALVLLLLGFSSKMGLMPFHVWLPQAHSQGPSHVSALLSGVMLNVALYAFLRVILFILPAVPVWFIIVMLVMGVQSACMGALSAIQEKDFKRVLAYSSIQHFGLIFLMLGVGLLAGQYGNFETTQTLLYLVVFTAIAHAIFKSGLFMVAGTVKIVTHTRNLDDMGGLAQRMPQFSVMASLLALAAAGLPPFAPFMAEWAFVQVMINDLSQAAPEMMIALVVVLAATAFTAGMAVFAMVKLFGLAFLGQPRKPFLHTVGEPDSGLLIPVVATAALSLLMGILSPVVFKELGAWSLINLDSKFSYLVIGTDQLSPVMGIFVIAVILLLLFLLRRWLTNPAFERHYHTWDCGQPINSKMEYTATGFSAPLRFFFQFWLFPKKILIKEPLIPGNPWLNAKSYSLEVKQVWFDWVYQPVADWTVKLARLVARAQTGGVQFYIGLLLLALVVTLVIVI